MAQPQKLDLKKRLSFRQYDHNHGIRQVEVGEVLAVLLKVQEEYPDGFLAVNAQRYITGAFNGVLIDGAGYYGSLASVYHQLVDSGYAECDAIPPSSPKRPPRYLFRIKPDALKNYESPTPTQVTTSAGKAYPLDIPEGLVLLMRSLGITRGVTQDQGTKSILEEVLEQEILSDTGFLRVMETLKQESPNGYHTMGGKYLDTLLTTRDQARGL